MDLPNELITEVVLYAAVSHLPTAQSLRLVCREFNKLVLSCLLRDIIFTTPSQIVHFAELLLPKRSYPLLFPIPPRPRAPPRAFDSYRVTSLALANIHRLPSAEDALERVATAFTSVRQLAITDKNLSSHGFWLRKDPIPIKPSTLMVFYYGQANPLDFHEPIFQSVTHLYCPTVEGFHDSSLCDVAALTHLALYSGNIGDEDEKLLAVVDEIGDILRSSPNLQVLVVAVASLFIYARWQAALTEHSWVLDDKRLIILPYQVQPMDEWERNILGHDTIWDRAQAWSLDGFADLDLSHWETGRMFDFPPAECRREWELSLFPKQNHIPSSNLEDECTYLYFPACPSSQCQSAQIICTMVSIRSNVVFLLLNRSHSLSELRRADIHPE